MDKIKIGTLVYVTLFNSGIGCLAHVKSICEDKAIVTLFEQFPIAQVPLENIHKVIPAPIDEKNIISDWINDELLSNCSQNGNEYLGWLYDKHPVYGKIHKNGVLELRSCNSRNIIPLLRSAINGIFRDTLNKDICLRLKQREDSLWVSFYFILDD